MFLATLLVAAEEEAPPPLIDIDGTLLLQFGLFLIMLFVLSKFLFGPYLKLRDLRRESIEGAREKAQAMDVKAAGIVSNYEVQLTSAKQKAAEGRQRLRVEAVERERQILGAARDEAGKATAAARDTLAKKAAETREQLQTQSAALAKQMASKILGREVA